MKDAYPPLKPFLPRPHPGQRSDLGTMGLWACGRRTSENVHRAWAHRRDAGLRLIPALPPSGSTKRSFGFLSGGPNRTAGTMATPFKARNIMVLAYAWRQRGNLGISRESCA